MSCMPNGVAAPLLLSHLLDLGCRRGPEVEVVTRISSGGATHRVPLREIRQRALRLAAALAGDGVCAGDRVATFMWNNWRHVEAYYAVPCMGAVLHTLNLRLPAAELEYIVRHAQDHVLLVDQSLLPLLEPLAGSLASVVRRTIVCPEAALGKWTTSLPNAVDYEEYLQLQPEAKVGSAWPTLDENSPMALCYTSGTTGNPKGVVYSHRSTYLHTMATGLTDSLRLSMRDSVLLFVPQFHAMGWCIPYTCLMTSARLVLPHRFMDPQSMIELLSNERVTMASGVPTIWFGVRHVYESAPVGKYDLSSLSRLTCGGSAPPQSLIRWWAEKLDVEMIHGWGMTETNPVVTLSHPVNRPADAAPGVSDDMRFENNARQGMPLPGLEMKIVDSEFRDLPCDGSTVGEVLVRGPWVCTSYYLDDQPTKFHDGWLITGDVGTLDQYGCLSITDRSKDLIKSGGEWISSVDLENHIMGMTGVLHAAVVAVPHPKWDERPIAVVVMKPDTDAVTTDSVRLHCAEKFAKWQLPDDVLVRPAIPLTATGKFDKKVVRKQLADEGYLHPELRTG